MHQKSEYHCIFQWSGCQPSAAAALHAEISLLHFLIYRFTPQHLALQRQVIHIHRLLHVGHVLLQGLLYRVFVIFTRFAAAVTQELLVLYQPKFLAIVKAIVM